MRNDVSSREAHQPGCSAVLSARQLPMRLRIIEDDLDAPGTSREGFSRGRSYRRPRDLRRRRPGRLAPDGQYDVLCHGRPHAAEAHGSARLSARCAPKRWICWCSSSRCSVRSTTGSRVCARAATIIWLKPYCLRVLSARRRCWRAGAVAAAQARLYRVADLELNRLSHQVSRAGQECSFSRVCWACLNTSCAMPARS